ncbi:MAG TPA: hypothetical protein VJN02_04065 [Gammaproteobacteria bacterium]|nr:hypothetical protein [Gammaproteobacteria bacterium]
MSVTTLKKQLFAMDYPTVQYNDNFKIVGPVKLPIKIESIKKNSMRAYLFAAKKENYLVCLFGNIDHAKNILVRISSACIFGFVCKSMLCDCHDQFEESIKKMVEADAGLLIFCMDQHGKGIGIEAHFLVYAEGQRRNIGLFSEIYEELGLKQDYRCYEETVDIIKYFKNKNQFERITMLTESPDKINFFKTRCNQLDIDVQFDSFETQITPENDAELSEKVELGYHIKNSLKKKNKVINNPMDFKITESQVI